MANTGLNTLGFIKTNSLTYTEIQKDLTDFIDALSEDEKLGFKTMFTGTNGQILVDMIAAKTSDELYHIINSRSENLLYYLNRLDSAIAIAQNNAYVVSRGNNIKLKLTVTPNETIQLSKMDVVGVAEDYDLIIMDDYNLTAGESTEIEVYIGNIEEQTLTADSEDLLVFRFTDQNVSDQYALYLNGDEVPTTENILEMVDDKYFCMTNAYQSVDAIYLNKRTNFTHRYSNGDELTLKYIKYAEITLSSIDIEFMYGEITDVEQMSSTVEPEKVNSVRTNAQLYAETQNRIVARDDFAKVFEISNPEIIDAVGEDYDSAHVEVTYVKENGELLTDAEYEAAYNNLYSRRAYGIPMCYLSHPDIMLNLNILIVLQLTSGNSAVIPTYIREVLANYELQLGATINFSDIEHAIEDYDFIKTARVLPNYKTYTPNTLSPEGTIYIPTTPNGKLYVVRNPLFLTGTSAPSWPTTIGATVVDNDLIWTAETKSYTAQPEWEASTSKRIENIVQVTGVSATQYKCTGYTYKTGLNEPVWPTTEGEYVEDNQILWVAVSKNLTADSWAASTIIDKGTVVNSTVTTELSYQAINYIPKTPIDEPAWSTSVTVFTDRNIEYAVINQDYDVENPSLSDIQLNWNQYVKFNETIKVI